MSYLTGKTVYLAGPISAVTDNEATTWRNHISNELEKFGCNILDPCKKTIYGELGDDKKMFQNLIKERKFQEVKEKFYPIVRKDLRMVDKSDFLIVVYDPTIHMCGTLAEVVLGHTQRKPMLLYIAPEHMEKINPWILTYFKVSWIYDDWNNMIEYLKQIDAGHFDTSYWTI